MAWLDATSGNPANKFVRYSAGGHGTEMFKAHPDLPVDIVAWYEATLNGKRAAVPAAARARPDDPKIRLLVMMDEPGGPARAAEILASEQKKNPGTAVLAPGFVNQLGYLAVEVQDPRAAVAIMQVNVDGHPKPPMPGTASGTPFWPTASGRRRRKRRKGAGARGLRHGRDRGAAQTDPRQRAAETGPAQGQPGERNSRRRGGTFRPARS
jgi:hypothetical protein